MASSSKTVEEYNSSRFINVEAEKKYITYLSHRIIIEDRFEPTDEDGDICRQFRELGWTNYMGLTGVANLSLVRELYVNLEVREGPEPIFVHRKDVYFTQTLINELLEITRTSPDMYSSLLEEGPNYDQILVEFGHPSAA